MICKNCDQEIDDASKFCEHCGENVSELSDSYYDSEDKISDNKFRKSRRKIYLTILFLFLLLLAYLYGNGRYYENISNIISDQIANFEFDGKQLINSIEIDYNTNQLKCNISSNNIDLKYLNEHSVNVQDYGINICEIYCVYDSNDKSISFQPKYGFVHSEPSDVVNSENVYDYNIRNCDDLDFSENEIYDFTYTVWFGVAEPNNILEKFYYKKNKDKLKREVVYTSYFIFKNGEFEPILPEEVSYEYVNLVLNGNE